MKVAAVLLAAGQGTRMKSDLPKVLHPLCGKPMLWHTLQAVKQASTEKPVVIVGHGAEQVQAFVGEARRLRHAGTAAGHCTRGAAGGASAQRKSGLRHRHLRRYAAAARRDLPAAGRDSAEQSRAAQPADGDGRRPARLWPDRAQSPPERCRPSWKNTSPRRSNLAIRELNVGAYCFKAEWLWDALHRIQKNPQKGEYYLTDVVELAVQRQSARAGRPAR